MECPKCGEVFDSFPTLSEPSEVAAMYRRDPAIVGQVLAAEHRGIESQLDQIDIHAAACDYRW